MSNIFRIPTLPRNRYSILKVCCVLVLVIVCSFLVRSTSIDINVPYEHFHHIEPGSLEWRREFQNLVPGYETETGNSNVTIVNPHPFRLLVGPQRLCDTTNGSILALIYIHSKPDNFYTRSGIRRTWGNMTLFSRHIRIAFVLGTMPEKPGLQIALKAEAKLYNDIIQEDFVDSYKNLTYKAIGALKWVSQYCANAEYILKVDDDVLVDTFTLIRVLKSMQQTPPFSDRKGKLWCRVWNMMRVQRVGKWRVEPEEFENDYYPRYCSGMAYMMTSDVAKALYMTSYSVPFFWVDDVYITGMLPRKMKLHHTDAQYYFVLRPERLIQEKFLLNDGYNSPIFAHSSGGAMTLELLWKNVLDLEEFLSRRGTPALHQEQRTSTTTAATKHPTTIFTGKLIEGPIPQTHRISPFQNKKDFVPWR